MSVNLFGHLWFYWCICVYLFMVFMCFLRVFIIFLYSLINVFINKSSVLCIFYVFTSADPTEPKTLRWFPGGNRTRNNSRRVLLPGNIEAHGLLLSRHSHPSHFGKNLRIQTNILKLPNFSYDSGNKIGNHFALLIFDGFVFVL